MIYKKISADRTIFNLNKIDQDKIDGLISKMTIEEKIGQLTQLGTCNEEREQRIRNGQIGSFLYISGAAETNRIQKIAMEESRLGIPLIFAADVMDLRQYFPYPWRKPAAGILN